ncbi:MAG: hypothetical protein NTX64_04875 [Elusimicrobia bacterium]|nr:hypothetical protein [Elusimicrobiota bacterium]
MPEASAAREIDLPRPQLLAAAAAVVFYLGFPPVACWPLTIVGASLFFGALASARSWRQALAVAPIFKSVSILPIGAYLSGLGTVIYVLAWLLYLIPFALVVGGGFWLARKVAGSAAGLLALPSLWTLSECYGTSLHFLPSLVTTWPQALAPGGVSVARYTGLWGVMTLAAFIAALPWLALLARRSPAARRQAAWGAALLALALLVPPVLARLADPGSARPGGAPLAVAVASLEANDAMESYLAQGTGTPEGAAAVAVYLKKRASAIAALLPPAKPDLYLIPEDAIDLVLSRSRSQEAYERFGIENNGALLDTFRESARERGMAWALGLTTVRTGGRRNSALLIDETGAIAGLRDKWRLTPGSEYWPLSPWIPLWLVFSGDEYLDPARPYVPAQTPFPLMRFKGWPVGVLICLEGHMPVMYRGWRRAGADVILFMANAHWFHHEPSAFNKQVLNIIRLSAAAYGIPVLLTGKASYCGHVDEFGRYEVWPWAGSPEEEAAHVVTVERPAAGLTIPARLGEYYLALSAALLPLILLGARLLRPD